MITKAIVESIIDRCTVQVRIPRLDRMQSCSLATDSAELNEAIICTLSNCHPNIRPGDIVFVALDDQNEDEVIILGYLYKEIANETFCDLILNNIEVKSKTMLSEDTTIGDITYQELKFIKGLNKNIIRELNDLIEKVTTLQEENKYLIDKIAKLEAQIGA